MSAPDGPVLIADRYRLEERIGVGAMGVVWRAVDELLGRTVAMKELLAVPTGESGPELEESRQRILREGRIGARLQHPHVISMFDVVIHEDRPWLVMEYLPSESLAARITREGPLLGGRDRGHRPPDGRRAGRGPSRGRRAPRCEARQRADRRERVGEADRFRRLPCRRRGAADPHGRDRRDACVPRAGGRAGSAAERGVGRLRARRHPVRGGRRGAAVRAGRQRVRVAAQGRDG